MNNTNFVISQLEVGDMEPFVPTLGTISGTIFAISTGFILVLSCLVQGSIIKFLLRRSDRLVNRMITPYQVCFCTFRPKFAVLILPFQISMAVLNPIYLSYIATSSFIYPMKNVVGTSGCYMISTTETWGPVFNHMRSFYITLFRYLCIAQNDFMHMISLSPKEPYSKIHC